MEMEELKFLAEALGVDVSDDDWLSKTVSVVGDLGGDVVLNPDGTVVLPDEDLHPLPEDEK